MSGSPEDYHAFEQGGARAARTDEEIEHGTSDGCRRVLTQGQSVLGGGNLEKLHFPSHVVQGRDKKVHGSIHGMELRVGGLRQPNLSQQLPHETHISPRIVGILN